MNRPVYGDRNWPRDFPGWMYLGTLIHFINRAIHPDAEAEDVVFARTFEERASPHDSFVLVSPDEDPRAERRAGVARVAALDELRRCAITPSWLDSRGIFHPVSPDGWRDGVSDRDLTAILVRAALPKDMIPEDEFAVLGDSVSIYVPSDQAAVVLAAFNRKLLYPSPPSRVLERLGAASTSNDSLWPLAAAVVWAATHDLPLARGAYRYNEDMGQRSLAKARGLALEYLARDEIAYYSCHCHRPVCRCWDDALRKIVSQANVGTLVARGFKNDAGNHVDVPEGAWSGPVEFTDGGSLIAAKPGGDRWTHIVFRASDVINAHPSPLIDLGPTSRLKETSNNEAQAADRLGARPGAISRLAEQLDRDGVPIRDVKASLIADLWDRADGVRPGVKEVSGRMTGGQKGRPLTSR